MRLILTAAFASGAAAACLSPPGASPVQTIPLLHVVNRAEALRGQVVRTCGIQFRRIDVTEQHNMWQISIPTSVGWHPAELDVLKCGDQEPKLDREGCITGRIARHDGALRVPGPDDIIVSDPGRTPYWALHAQCPTR